LEVPTTEDVTKSHRSLPQSLTSLRQKLGQKAKQEPKFRFYTLCGHICRTARFITVHASGESLQESRMREIRTSGLRRGSLPSLRYLSE